MDLSDGGNSAKGGGGGIVEDLSDNSNDLTLQNGASIFDASLKTDGVNDNAACSSSADFDIGLGNWSVAIWVKFTTTGTPDYRSVISRGSLNTDNGFGFFVDSVSQGNTAKMFFQFRKASTIVSVGSTDVMDDGNWHHYVATIERGSSTGLKLYIDGNLNNSTGSTALDGQDIIGFSQLVFGESSGLAFPFKGQIKETRLYNRALSSSEVSILYNSTITRFLTENIILWWKKFSSTTAIDKSGNFNDGTVLNNATVTSGPGGGQALLLNGVNQYIKSDVDLSGITSTSSASIWFKLTSNTTGYLTAYNDDGSTYLSSTYNSSVGLEAGRRLNAGSITFDYNTNWHHLVWTWDGSSLLIYLDGVLKTQGSSFAVNTNNTQFQVGARQDSAQNFLDGTIADFRIYERCLSSVEIQTLYSNGAK